ncbi:MAG: GNAT family N-acetyltransferase [Halieaceae bacterium]|jgi:GNAT superfamily N-acetyltransferase|nr:GNAT family N-acetyltransferase [Halieaceae bacterium]
MSHVFDIRPATQGDIPQIMAFIRELAEYEREPDAVVATDQDLETALFSKSPRVFAVLCWDGEIAVGLALYFYNFSTWLGRLGLYLEDLYVTPEQRGRGAGKQLLRHLARIAVDEHCGRFEWSVLDWNQPAIDFYESFGARPQSEWTTYRLHGEALTAFASKDDG